MPPSSATGSDSAASAAPTTRGRNLAARAATAATPIAPPSERGPHMRPIWNGHITFGLISIPVSLSAAVEASERVSFRLLHRKDKAPIVYKKFCSKEDVEVPNDEIVRGFEVDDDEYALVEKEEIEKAEKEAGGSDDM